MLRAQGSCPQPVHWRTLRKDPVRLFCLVYMGHVCTLHVTSDLIVWPKVSVEGAGALERAVHSHTLLLTPQQDIEVARDQHVNLKEATWEK